MQLDLRRRAQLGLAVAATLLPATLALCAFPAPASAVRACYLTFLMNGNYTDNNCMTEVAALRGSYVLAELVFKKIGTVWCALLGVFTGEFQSGACTTLENNGLYTRVRGPNAKNEIMILPEAIESSLKASAKSSEKSSEFILVTAGKMEIKCKSSTGSSEFTTPNEGTFSLSLSECKGSLGGTCTGEGLGKGSIALSGKVDYWQGLLAGKTVDTLVYLLNEAKATCEETVKVLVKGCAAALAEPIEKTTKSTKDVFTEEKGADTIAEVLAPEATKSTKCAVEAKFGEKTEGAGISATEENEKFELGGKATEITLMK